MANYLIEKYTEVIQTGAGWAVKSVEKVPAVIVVTPNSKEKDVCKDLKSTNAIPSTSTMRTIQFTDFDKDIIEVVQKKDYKPLCRLVIKKF